MKAKILAAAALITLGALGSASAADLPMPAPEYKAPPPPPVYNWTGCYIAGGGGYGWWNEDSQVVTTATGAPVAAQVTNGGKGWFGQGQGGCDYQFNLPLGSWNIPVVIGAFGDWEGGSIRGTNSDPLVVGTENEFEHLGSRRPRRLPRNPALPDLFRRRLYAGPLRSDQLQFLGRWHSGRSCWHQYTSDDLQWLVHRQRLRICVRLVAGTRPVPEDRIPLRAIQYGHAWVLYRGDRSAVRYFPPNDQVHPDGVDRTGVALQLVRRPLVIDAKLS